MSNYRTQIKSNTHAPIYLSLLLLALLAPEVAMAQFQRATTAAQTFKDWLWLIVPIIGACIGVCIGLAYSADVVRKDTAIQWGGGIAFAGAVVGGFIGLFF